MSHTLPFPHHLSRRFHATGNLPVAGLPGRDFMGFEALKDLARMAADERSGLAVNAPVGAIVRETDPQEGIAVEYPLAALLVQALTHSTEHRTQVSAIITQLGIEPPDLAGWAWIEERGQFLEYRQ